MELLKSTITSLKREEGRSEVMNGIQIANNLLKDIYTRPYYMQPKKFIIVLTDGLFSTPSHVRFINEPDVRTLAVAVGYDVSHYYIKAIVGNMSRVFPYHDDRLSHFILSQLIEPSCKSE